MNNIEDFLKNYDFKGMAQAYRDQEIAWSAEEWKQFIELVEKREREKIKKELGEMKKIFRCFWRNY